MKTIIAFMFFLAFPLLSHAGKEQAWKWFYIELQSAESALESKKIKFSETEYTKLITELKDAEDMMFKGKGSLDRQKYYELNNVQEARVKAVKAIADEKQ